MTKDKLIKELESGLKNPNVPETFKDKIRVKLAALKAEEPKENKGKEKTTDVRSLIKYKNKFNVGDIVVSKKDNSTYKVDSFVKRNADFIYTLSNEIKNNVYHIEEEDLKLKTPAKKSTSKPKFKVGDVVVLKGEETLPKEIVSIKESKTGVFYYEVKFVSKPSEKGMFYEYELEIYKEPTISTIEALYDADSKGWSATKADSGSEIRNSEVLTKKYAEAVKKALTEHGIKKGSLTEADYDILVDDNYHLLNEFLSWNNYYDEKTAKNLQEMYQRIYDRGTNSAADPEAMLLEATYKPTKKKTTPIKKAINRYVANREIKSVTILEDGKKLTYAGKDVLNGANFFKEGGVLTSKATYVPIRNIVEVTFEDGSKDKPRNGYHIKNGATPIMEHGGEVKEYAIKLVPLELEPLSSQLKSYTRDSLTSGDYTNESGKEYSTAPGEIIVHKASGRKFEIPEKIYDYVDGFNLVYDKNKNKIVTWEEGNLVAEVKDGKLDFANKDESIFIDKTKVESEFKKGFIPEKSNEKWAYIAIEGKLQNLYAISEDLEDDKTTNAWKNNQAKIEKFEDFLHRIERKYAVGGTVELPEGSLQHFENYYLEKGGEVESVTKEQIVQYLETVPADKLANDYAYIMSKDLDRALYQANDPDYRPHLIDILGNEITANRNAKNKKVLLQEIGYLEFGGRLKSALNRDRKYVNKSQDYETRYAKGKNRKGYSKFEKGGPIPQKGDFAKVPVSYGMYHYGLIKGIIKDNPIYPQNGYEIVGIGDVLHPEQFEVVTESEFEKQKSTGTDVKTNSFLVIEEKLEKGGVLKVGDEVVDFDTMKHLGKVVEVSEINLDEDDIIVETPEGKTIKLNSFNVLRKPNVKANLGASPEVKLSIEELKAKHSVSNYGKGGKTDKEDPRGANFRLAKEIRQPGERWQDAVSRATKMLK